MKLDMGTDQAKTVLDKMVAKGYAEILVSEKGAMVYEIIGMNVDKENTKSVLD